MNVFDTMAIEELIPYSIAIIVIFAALLSIIYTIWGWFLMIISAGTEEKVKKAVNHIRHAIIWVIFILWVLYVLPVLMKLSGIPYEEYMKPKVVFDTMVKISDLFCSICSCRWCHYRSIWKLLCGWYNQSLSVTCCSCCRSLLDSFHCLGMTYAHPFWRKRWKGETRN